MALTETELQTLNDELDHERPSSTTGFFADSFLHQHEHKVM